MASFAPYLYDWVWTVAALAVPVALAVAVVQITRMDGLSASTRLVLTLAMIVLPVLGPVAWFVARARSRAARIGLAHTT